MRIYRIALQKPRAWVGVTDVSGYPHIKPFVIMLIQVQNTYSNEERCSWFRLCTDGNFKPVSHVRVSDFRDVDEFNQYIMDFLNEDLKSWKEVSPFSAEQEARALQQQINGELLDTKPLRGGEGR